MKVGRKIRIIILIIVSWTTSEATTNNYVQYRLNGNSDWSEIQDDKEPARSHWVLIEFSASNDYTYRVHSTTNVDSDGDGLTDYYEFTHRYTVKEYPCHFDPAWEGWTPAGGLPAWSLSVSADPSHLFFWKASGSTASSFEMMTSPDFNLEMSRLSPLYLEFDYRYSVADTSVSYTSINEYVPVLGNYHNLPFEPKNDGQWHSSSAILMFPNVSPFYRISDWENITSEFMYIHFYADTASDYFDLDNIRLVRAISPYMPDTDGDGYIDIEDFHPLYDALANIYIKEAGVCKSGDSPDVGTEGDFYLKVLMDDEWDSGVWQHSPKPIQTDNDYLNAADFPSGDGITIVRNIPDNQQYIKIQIELWDEDPLPSSDDEMDLDGENSDDKTLNLLYDTVLQSWQGDGVSGSYPDYSISCGEGDGGDGAIFKEDDGKLKFTIYTDAELSSETKQALADKYSPIMYFNEGEQYFPIEIKAMLDQSDLKDSDGDVLANHPLIENDLVNHNSASNYMDQISKSQSGYDHVIYSSVFTANDGKIVIQYWFFYVYNDGQWLAPDHEGDWEMIQIICDEEGSPQKAGYSWHYEMKKSGWTSGRLQKWSNHPKVFVEKGGHASNFETASWGSYYVHEDVAASYSTSGTEHPYKLTLLSAQKWLKFRGIWGEDSGSVQGPVFRYSKTGTSGLYVWPLAYMWVDPIYWYTATHNQTIL